MKILHIASFKGNIGDNANHIGFRDWFEKLVKHTVEWENIEIREFYRSKRKWDNGFAKEANAYDLVIIGGGNYFELWVEKSPSGTSIEISPEVLRKIETPIIFNALGVDIGQGYSDQTKLKFQKFLEIALNEKNSLVTVRNDGAIQALKKLYGEKYDNKIHEVPDAGFFGAEKFKDIDSAFSNLISKEGKKIIGINLAGDMPEQRFSNFAGSTEKFARKFCEFIENLSKTNPEYYFLFLPHIYKDYDVINKVLLNLSDSIRRDKCLIAPYGPSDDMVSSIFSSYKACDIVLANRFHANVCSLGMNIKTVGLVNYLQIQNFYQSIGKLDSTVDINKIDFPIKLQEHVISCLQNSNDETIKRVNEEFKRLRTDYEAFITKWFKEKKIY